MATYTQYPILKRPSGLQLVACLTNILSGNEPAVVPFTLGIDQATNLKRGSFEKKMWVTGISGTRRLGRIWLAGSEAGESSTGSCRCSAMIELRGKGGRHGWLTVIDECMGPSEESLNFGAIRIRRATEAACDFARRFTGDDWLATELTRIVAKELGHGSWRGDYACPVCHGPVERSDHGAQRAYCAKGCNITTAAILIGFNPITSALEPVAVAEEA